jgi:glutaredoxin-related protein
MYALVQVHPAVAAGRASFHPDIVRQVSEAVAQHDVVCVGMAWNPFCAKAVKLLTERGIKHEYLEYGNYMSKWKERLALKLWAGWPTFPQVYVHGVLIGGYKDLVALDASGELNKLLAAGRAK